MKDVVRIECTASPNADPQYLPVISNLEVKASENPSTLTLLMTNTGSVNAQNVTACALFFDASGNVVDYYYCYFNDALGNIAPGASLAGQMTTYESYDHVKYYLQGKSDGSTTSGAPKVSQDSFSAKEYSYESEGSTLYYLAIKNNSAKTVGIRANVTAYDAKGKMLGAGDGLIYVVGAGEETITQLYLENVTGIDHIECRMSFKTAYSPVLNKISTKETQTSDGVEISITNNTSKAIKTIAGYALFFDANGKLVYANFTYFIDEDGELKAGDTLTQEIYSFEDFSTVKCYYAVSK